MEADKSVHGLTRQELKDRFDVLDVDGTGRVTVAEYIAARAAWKDGQLTFDEYSQIMRTRDDGADVSPEERKRQFEALDRDGTGMVSLQEYTKAAAPATEGSSSASADES